MTKFEILFAQLQSDYKADGTVNPIKITAIKAEIASNPNQPIIDEPYEFVTISDVFELWIGAVVSEESWKREMQDTVVTKEDIKAIKREMRLARIPFIGSMLVNSNRS